MLVTVQVARVLALLHQKWLFRQDSSTSTFFEVDTLARKYTARNVAWKFAAYPLWDMLEKFLWIKAVQGPHNGHEKSDGLMTTCCAHDDLPRPHHPRTFPGTED